jgi:hypothetical protein
VERGLEEEIIEGSMIWTDSAIYAGGLIEKAGPRFDLLHCLAGLHFIRAY